MVKIDFINKPEKVFSISNETIALKEKIHNEMLIRRNRTHHNFKKRLSSKKKKVN